MVKYGIAKRDLADKDWKTQLARGYPDIPKGSTVKIIEEGMVNFYGGPWTRVEFDGNWYWVAEDDIEQLTTN